MKYMDEINTDDMTLTEIFLLTEKMAEAYTKRRKVLTAHLSAIDKELSVLLHEIETSNLNVVGGFKLYDRCRELRRLRRVIKNDMNAGDTLVTCGLDMDKFRFDASKAVKNVKFSEEQRECERQYLNQDTLKPVGWREVLEETGTLDRLSNNGNNVTKINNQNKNNGKKKRLA